MTTPTLNDDRLLTSHEVAALLQMDPSSVVKWVAEGKLQAFRTPGGHRRVRADVLRQFLQTYGMFTPPALAPPRPKVLVVDEDKKQLGTLQRAMKNQVAIDLLVASDGIEGLIQVGAQKPNFLVIDVSMPGLDGFAVCKQLKSNPETKSIEVVMMSGRTSEELEKKSKAAGARALLSRPVTGADLLKIASPGSAPPKE